MCAHNPLWVLRTLNAKSNIMGALLVNGVINCPCKYKRNTNNKMQIADKIIKMRCSLYMVWKCTLHHEALKMNALFNHVYTSCTLDCRVGYRNSDNMNFKTFVCLAV